MTSDPTTDHIPTTVRDLADLMYRQHTPDLFDRLAAQLGDHAAAAHLWWSAADLLERCYPIPRDGRPEPRPYDVVFTRNSVDHAIVPGQTVTVCGLELPVLFSVNPPYGNPCGDCFGGNQ